MLGPEGVARAVASKVSKGHLNIVKRLRARHGLDENDLPALSDVFPGPPGDRAEKGAGDYPYAYITIRDNTGRLGNRENPPTGVQDQYQETYNVEVTILAMGNTPEAAVLLMHRLALAVRDGVRLDRLIDKLPDGDSAEVGMRDYRAAYFDAVTTANGGCEAAARLTFPVTTTENLLTDAAWRNEVPKVQVPPPVVLGPGGMVGGVATEFDRL